MRGPLPLVVDGVGQADVEPTVVVAEGDGLVLGHQLLHGLEDAVLGVEAVPARTRVVEDAAVPGLHAVLDVTPGGGTEGQRQGLYLLIHSFIDTFIH